LEAGSSNVDQVEFSQMIQKELRRIGAYEKFLNDQVMSTVNVIDAQQNVTDSVMSLFIASQEDLELDGLDNETRELWHTNLANLKNQHDE